MVTATGTTMDQVHDDAVSWSITSEQQLHDVLQGSLQTLRCKLACPFTMCPVTWWCT